MRAGVYVLIVLTAGAYLPSPLYPAYQGIFGISDLTMTLVYATFALVSAPALVLFGPASDVLGPRPVLRASIVVAAVGSTCFAVASGPTWLLVGRAAQGLALGAATGAAGVLISARPRGRGGMSGPVLASIAFVAGTACGPAAGGVLAQYAPAPHVLPFVLHLALLGIGWRRVSALAESARSPRRWTPARPEIPRGMRLLFVSAAATGFLAWTAAGLFLAVIPVLLDRAAGTGPAVTGAVLAAVLLCSLGAQPLVARLGARYAQLAGLAAVLVGLGVLAITAAGSTSATLVAAVVVGAGHGLAYGAAAAEIEAVTPAGRRGGVLGALYLAFYLGAGCPAVAVGLVTLRYSLSTATSWITAVAAGLVPVVGVLVLLVRHPTVAHGRADRDDGERTRELPPADPVNVRAAEDREPGRPPCVVGLDVRPGPPSGLGKDELPALQREP